MNGLYCRDKSYYYIICKKIGENKMKSLEEFDIKVILKELHKNYEYFYSEADLQFKLAWEIKKYLNSFKKSDIISVKQKIVLICSVYISYI